MSIQLVEPMPVQLTPELEQHAELRGSQFGNHVPDSMNVVQWMPLAEPGMTASTDSHGHITYSFDVSRTRLAADSTYAGIAELTCAVYNALPAESRVASANIDPAVIAFNANCVSQTREISYWWGGKIYFNHCACNDVELVLGGTVAFTSLAAGILGVIAGSTTVAAPVAAVAAVLSVVCLGVAAAAGTYLAAFVWADAKSNNGGAYLNFTWASPGTPWVTPA